MNRFKKILVSDIIKKLNVSNIPTEYQSAFLDIIEECDNIVNETEQVHEFRRLVNVKTPDLLDAEQNLTSKDIFQQLDGILDKFISVVQASGTYAIEHIYYRLSIHRQKLCEKYANRTILFNQIRGWHVVPFDFVKLQASITEMKYDIGHLICATGLHETDPVSFLIHHTNNMGLITQDGFIDADILENRANAKGICIHPETAGREGTYILKCVHDPSGEVSQGTIMEPPGYEKLNIWEVFKGRLSKLTKIVPILLVFFLVACSSCNKTEVIEITTPAQTEVHECTRHDCIAFDGEGNPIKYVRYLQRHLYVGMNHITFTGVGGAEQVFKEVLKKVYNVPYNSVECVCND